MTTPLHATLWEQLGDTAPMPEVELTGEPGGLPSPYAVSDFAVATVALATAAVAELDAARAGTPARRAIVDRRHAAVAFRSERYQEPIGWVPPALWDPIAGDYRAADGWIRIHTNYASHRVAARRALGLPAAADVTRDAVAAAVAAREASELESSIVDEGGAAARMRTAAAWAEHAQGAAVAREPLFAIASAAGTARMRASRGAGLAGLRVLDLTRVIAGPVCTRVLAAYGADVLRIDPPGFVEVPALLPDATAGKRRAALDLRSDAGRARFEELVAGADLLVSGYRAPALDRLGLGLERLRELQPALAIVQHDAYGWTGPWRDRRGFDSLVQMSCGIAARCSTAADGAPGALPAQALDHGTGYLLAAAACRALTRLVHGGPPTTTRLSLARTAHLLASLGTDGDPRAAQVTSGEPFRERADTGFGPIHRVTPPGRLAGLAPRWTIAAGPLGSDAAAWRA